MEPELIARMEAIEKQLDELREREKKTIAKAFGIGLIWDLVCGPLITGLTVWLITKWKDHNS